MGIYAGDLRTRIEVLRQDTTLERGEPVPAGWTVIATPWAEVIGQDGREALIAKTLEGISTYRVRIRWRAGLLPSDQIRLDGAGGIDLNIKSLADPDGRREQLTIIASTDGAQKTS